MSEAENALIERNPKYLAVVNEVAQKTVTIEELHKENCELRRLLYLARFASKSEKRKAQEEVNNLQVRLFDKTVLPEAKKAAEVIEAEIEVPAHKRRARKRYTDKDGDTSHFPAELERKEIKLKPEGSKQCSACGKQKKQIDVVITERLQVIPCHYYVEKFIRPVLGCNCKECVPVKANMPEAVLPKSVLGTSFIAQSITQKFAWHLPFYRQSQMLMQVGIDIDRDVLINTALKVAKELRPIVKCMAQDICRASLVHIDETPVMVALRGSDGKKHFDRNSFFWPILADGMVVFEHTGNRRHSNVKDILGDDFKGIIMTDGYEAYKSYADSHPDVTLALCWDHARRKFFEIAEIEPLAKEAVDKIGYFYHVESDIRELQIEQDKIADYRKVHALDKLNEFYQWCKVLRDTASLLPKSKLFEAVSYVINHWVGLTAYLKHGIIPISNIKIEQQIRNLKLGAKNWLFAASELGAEAVAIYNSLVCTCKMNQINVLDYFSDILTRLGSDTASALTPIAWNNARKNQLVTVVG